jgi:DNA polymerase III subunit delta
MKLNSSDLFGHLKQGLHNAYLVSGDDPLLVEEACDAIRQAAAAQGFDEREVMHVLAGFSWDQFAASSQNLSLFSEKRLIECRIPNGKPGDAGSRALMDFLENPNPDTILICITPKLDAAISRTRWVKAFIKDGVAVTVWPLKPQQLPGWLKRRAQQLGLKIQPDALQLIAEHCEGNLLAAKQVLTKCQLSGTEQAITLEDIRSLLSNSSHYDVFQFVDTLLAGNAKRALKMLSSLRGEGVEPILILWAVSRECQLGHELAWGQAQGQSLAALYQAHNVWRTRQTYYQQACQRLQLETWRELVMQTAYIDRLIKGGEQGDVWVAFERLCLTMC